ncbi:MAG: hypothetical protein ABI318_05285, partial [Chthoniobacteraceae bacterium]
MRPPVPIAVLTLALATAAPGTARTAETVKRPAKVPTQPVRAAQKWNPLWWLGNADDPEPP